MDLVASVDRHHRQAPFLFVTSALRFGGGLFSVFGTCGIRAKSGLKKVRDFTDYFKKIVDNQYRKVLYYQSTTGAGVDTEKRLKKDEN